MIKNLLLAMAALAVFAPALAQSDEEPFEPRAGRDYRELDAPLPVRVPANKIEVMEFFNFSCPHCFRLQRHLLKWEEEQAAAGDVAVVRQPVVFERWRGHYARVYYVISALGEEKNYARDVYNAIHRERELINSKSRFLDWIEEKGESRDKTEAIYDSFAVATRAARAETMAADYGIDSTPNIAVAGKYVVSPAMSGSFEGMIKTVDALVERERKARGG
jgi:thiol:disulfide interchange protein DsbA